MKKSNYKLILSLIVFEILYCFITTAMTKITDNFIISTVVSHGVVLIVMFLINKWRLISEWKSLVLTNQLVLVLITYIVFMNQISVFILLAIFLGMALLGNYIILFKSKDSSLKKLFLVNVFLKTTNLLLSVVTITVVSYFDQIGTIESKALVLLLIIVFFQSLISIIHQLITSNYVIPKKTLTQLCFVLGIMSLFWNMAVLSPYTLKFSFYSITFLVIGLTSLNTFFIAFVYKRLNGRNRVVLNKLNFKKLLISNPVAYIIIILIVLFSLDINVNPIFDSALYLKYISQIPSLFDFTPLVCYKLLQVVNHCAGALSSYYLLGLFIFPFNHIVANVLSLIIMVSATIAFERILNYFYTGDSFKWQRAFGTAIFAFSPTIYGSALKITPDVIVAFFLVLMICSSLYEYKILTVFFGICMIYSKTPAIIIYLSFILGIFLFQIVVMLLKKEKSIVGIIKEYWYYLVPVASFGYWYYIMKDSIWIYDNVSSVRHSMGFSKVIFNELFLHVFTVNFYWVFYIIIIISFITKEIRYINTGKGKDVLKGSWMRVYIITFIGFFMFNALYFTTYRHARYITPLHAFSAFFVFCGVQNLTEKKRVKNVLLLLLSLLMLTSTFRTYDPMLLSNFPYIKTDNQVMSMYDRTSHYNKEGLITDVMLYNREYVMIDKLYVDFLNKVDYGEDDVTIILDYHPFHAQFSGNPGHISYIRTDNGRRTYDYDPDNEIKSISLTSDEFNEAVDLPKEAYFLRVWQQDEALLDVIKQKYIIEEDIDVHRGRYYLHVYKIKLKDTSLD